MCVNYLLIYISIHISVSKVKMLTSENDEHYTMNPIHAERALEVFQQVFQTH